MLSQNLHGSLMHQFFRTSGLIQGGFFNCIQFPVNVITKYFAWNQQFLKSYQWTACINQSKLSFNLFKVQFFSFAFCFASYCYSSSVSLQFQNHQERYLLVGYNVSAGSDHRTFQIVFVCVSFCCFFFLVFVARCFICFCF